MCGRALRIGLTGITTYSGSRRTAFSTWNITKRCLQSDFLTLLEFLALSYNQPCICGNGILESWRWGCGEDSSQAKEAIGKKAAYKTQREHTPSERGGETTQRTRNKTKSIYILICNLLHMVKCPKCGREIKGYEE